MADFLARLAARALGQSTMLQPLQVPSAAPSPAAAQLPGDWESLVQVEPNVPVTPAPSAETLRLMRQVVAPELAEVYPQFAARVFGTR